MAKGAPNEKDPSKILNFVAKVWDEKAKAYKPIYIAPDATDNKQGDVWLSDEIDGTDGKTTDIRKADVGITAATPYAVKRVNDEVIKKVDRTTTDDQSIKSSLLPDGDNVKDLGAENKKWKNVYATTFNGALNGNAATASALDHTVTFSVKNGNAAAGTVTSNLSGNAVSINVGQLDAATVTTGILPLSVIPKAAQERLTTVANQAARFALTIDNVQEGDTVYQTDTQTMYLVVDSTKLNQAAGYQEYKAGTAVRAMQADKLDPGAAIQTDLASEANPTFTGTAAIKPGVTGILPLGHGGTGVALTQNPSLQVNLGSTDADIVFKNTPRPGIYGTLGIANGGTNITTNPSMIVNLGTEAADNVFKETPRPGIMGTLALGHGGTGVALNTQPSILVDLESTNATNVFAATPRPGITGILPIEHGGTGNSNGLAASATQLQNSRNFSITGDVVAAAVGFNGTGNVVLSTTLQDNTVTSAKIVNGTIITDDLANNSVTTAKIVDGNITTAKIADLNVTTGKIAEKNVTTAKLADSAVTTVKIADENVTTAKIANDAVDLTKLGADVGTVYVGTTQPTDNNVLWWIDTTDDD